MHPLFFPCRAAAAGLAGLLLALAPLLVRAQTGSLGIGTTTPNPKAALDISATDKGLLIPRLTAAQRTAIATPPDGLMVFQTDGTTGFWYWFGGAWVNIPTAATAGDNLGNHTATQNFNLSDKLLVGGTAGAPGTEGLSLTAAGVARLGTLTAPATGDRLLVDGGNVRLGAAPWRTAADDRLLKFGDGDFVMIGEAGADHQLELRAATFSVRAGLRTGTHPTTLPFYATADVGESSAGFEFRHSNGSQGIGLGYNTIYATGSNAVQNLNLLPLGTGGVGIGTTAPAATLHVAGAASTVRLSGLGGTGTRVVTADADGDLRTVPTASLADNLGNHTATQNLRLGANQLVGGGGTEGLSISSAGNVGIGTTAPAARLEVQSTLRVRGDEQPREINQPPVSLMPPAVIGPLYRGQSFSLPVGSRIQRIAMYVQVGSSTFRLFKGIPGDSLLAAQAVTYLGLGGTMTSIVFSPAVDATAGGTYSFSLGAPLNVAQANGIPPGGVVYDNRTVDYPNGAPGIASVAFRLFYTVPGSSTLYTTGAGNVGIGTDVPKATLDVSGSARIRNLRGGTVPRMVVADTSGTLSAAALPAAADNLGNHLATQPIGFTTNDADKLLLTAAYGVNGPKISHAAGWNLDYYAGPNNQLVGVHRFLTGTATGWQERLRIAANGNVGIGTASPAAMLDVAGTTRLGAAGTAFAALLRSTQALDVGSIPPQNTRVETLTVAGAAIGATVLVSPDDGVGSLGPVTIAYAYVSGANTVRIGFSNPTGSVSDPGPQTYHLTVIQ